MQRFASANPLIEKINPYAAVLAVKPCKLTILTGHAPVSAEAKVVVQDDVWGRDFVMPSLVHIVPMCLHTEDTGQVLGIVYRTIAMRLIKKAGMTHKTGYTSAVTLIQRFGSALNLNIHFHMLFLDGVYIGGTNGARFHLGNRPV